MRQGTFATRAAVLALVLMGAGFTLEAKVAQAAPAARAESKPRAAKAAALRQFTGVVTALDKSSITVEKRGKRARTMVFDRSDDTKTTGDLAKDTRVTVYYRDDGGKTVAHRVIVKGAGSTATSAAPRRR
jgi:protein-disulfide isomerase